MPYPPINMINVRFGRAHTYTPIDILAPSSAIPTQKPLPQPPSPPADPKAQTYATMWNQLKPAIWIDNRPCEADLLVWTYTRVKPNLICATTSWTYVQGEDPWKPLNTSLHKFDLFMDTMFRLFRAQDRQFVSGTFSVTAKHGHATITQYYNLSNTPATLSNTQ